jgi:hypothetical protein
MSGWRNFLDSLDTDGGHIFAMFALLVVGLVFYAKVDATSGGTIVIGTFSALLVLLKTKGSNSEQVARAGAPYQPPQPPPAALTPAVVVGDQPLPASTTSGVAPVTSTTTTTTSSEAKP